MRVTERFMPRTYTDQEKEEFVALAQQVGIGRAIRDLGYPSWPTGRDWCQERGVEVSVDTLMQAVKSFHRFYEDSDALIIVEEALSRVQEKLLTGNLDADELKKVTEALQKSMNTWLALKGKPGSITETQTKDKTDLELLAMLHNEKAKNEALERGLS